MVKRVRRAMGGVSQVERICLGAGGRGNTRPVPDAPHTPTMTYHFWLEWRSSKKLQSLFRASAGDANMDVNATAERIVSLKKVTNSDRVRANLRACLSDIRGVNALRDAVARRQAEKFVVGDPTHEEKLDRLWGLLLPGQTRAGGRITREWGRIGFQGKDPSTDFRGGGVLSLDQLLWLTRNRQAIAQRMIAEPLAEEKRYPWACVGINLTEKAIAILNSHTFDKSLYGKPPEQAMEIFHGMYADMFEILHGMWVDAKPENLLAFPPVLEKAMGRIHEEIKDTGALVPPGV